jgi:hypothetical protein
MANALYNVGKGALLRGDIDLENDTIMIALVTSSYTPNIDTHEDFADVTNEVSATGYTSGGATLSGKSVTVDTTNDCAEFDATDPVWTITGSVTARGAILYKSTGTPSTSPLLAYFDFGGDETATDGDFTIQFNAEGALQLG